MSPEDGSTEALVWLRTLAELAGKGTLDSNLDARAVLRAIRQAEAEARREEREACAALADDFHNQTDFHTSKALAIAIRARGDNNA